MIHRIVQFALQQRFVVLMFTVLIVVAGAISFQRMPVDAYPDLSPPMVELITQWPGHAAEEVERLTTLPLELAMNGSPNLRYMRSISLYGLSDVILTFDEGTDAYFARQIIFQRISDASLPSGVTPSMAPLFSPSGLVYRYVIDSPDRSPMELHTYEAWVLERAYRSVPGVADDSGFGGPTMEYHVELDPARLYNFHLPVVQVLNALQANNANTGGGFYTQGGQFYYVRGLGLLKSTDDIGEVVVGSNNGVPIRVKDVGPDLQVLEQKAVEIKNILDKTPGYTQLTVVRELGQPSLIVDIDRPKIARYGINVADVEAVVQAAVGGQAATQVIQGEKLFDLVVRMEPQYRSNATQISNLLVPAPAGQQIPLSELATIKQAAGASFIYRENNSRYIGIQFSVTGRDLEGIVHAGQRAVAKSVQLPEGYRLDWGGEYSELLEAKAQLYVIGPLAIFLIFLILFALYGNFKFPVTIALGVVLTEPVGALIALKLTHTPFSVSSGLGLLALLGVSVETAVILVSYINKLRNEGANIREATREASLLRLRPIMMTALVACLGLLPAAMSTGVGSDTQKPFAIVVVAGLLSRLLLGFFVNPVLYEAVAREGDVLQV
jgi:Cu/Ag efflux pump CusA